MAEKTNISWTDMTFNPWIGCTALSPACDGCYAEHLMDTRLGRASWGGPGKGVGTRSRTSEANWRQPLRWDRAAEREGTRPFVFCASLADVFDNQVPAEWRADLLNLIADTPRLVWLLLTKRPQNIVDMIDDAAFATGMDAMPPNIALGTTVEDQKRFDLNVPAIRKAKKELEPAFAFLSCEPLLSPLVGSLHDIDWVITGGETDQGSHKARPTNPQWFRDIRDQCAKAGIRYHHKQNGEWVSVSEVEGPGDHFRFPDGRTVRKTGKKLAGRTIDGVIHDDRPEVR